MDVLDATEKLLFLPQAVTAEHEFGRSAPLQEKREHLRREIELSLVELQALDFEIDIGESRKQGGHLPRPAAARMETDNSQVGKGAGQGGKQGRVTEGFHAGIPAAMELNRPAHLLTEAEEGKNLGLRRVLIQL